MLLETFETNFFAPVALTRELLPLIRKAPAGRVVNVSSILGSLTLQVDPNSPIYASWHFTVDDHSIYQTLPTNETGEHADYEGEGNRSSIRIEMCVNRGNNLGSTIDRTAQLTAKFAESFAKISHAREKAA